MTDESAGRSPHAARIGWGLPDAVAAWAAGLVAGSVAVAVVTSVEGRSRPGTAGVLVAVVAQFAASVAVAVRAAGKGRGHLRDDFGLIVRLRDARWALVGAAGQVAGTVAMWPIVRITGERDPQELVRILRDAPVGGFVLMAPAVVVLAPVAEELVFRGILLRSMCRRLDVPAAVVTAAVGFAAVHLLDPGATVVVAPLLGLGLAAGFLAVRTGELSAPIWLHAGFNAATVVLLAATR